MALHAQDLLEPVGDLNPRALWPQYKVSQQDLVEEALEAYLTQGYARSAAITVSADKDEAARQYARYRALQQAYERLLLMPSTSETRDEGSGSYLLTQMEHVGELAAAALEAHEALVDAAAGVGAVAVVLNRASESRALGFTW